MSVTHEETILDATITTRENLRHCLLVPRLTRNGWAENRLLDFNLWCAGAGVFADGKLSFDHRLAAKPEILASVIDLLHLLNIFIENCVEKAQMSVLDSENAKSEKTRESRDPDGGNRFDIELSTEEIEGRKDVESIITQIITLTLAIRSAGSRTRFQRADNSFDAADPRLDGLRRTLELIIHPRGPKQGGVVDTIQQGLIKANLQRRHRFNYARAHAINLSGPRLGRQGRDTVEARTDQVPQKPAGDISTDTPSERVTKPSEPTPSIIAPTSVTAASALESTAFVDARRPSRTLSVTTHKIDYPRPPPILKGNDSFKCPCCCQLLPRSLVDRNRWKQHLASDILPYACVLPECMEKLQFFVTRKDWEQHLNEKHGQYWNCFICEQLAKSDNHEFKDEKSISHHLQTFHKNAISLGEVPMLINASHHSKLPEIISCPLCPGPVDDEDIMSHLARCLHDFSLRSLPSPPESCGFGDYFGEPSEGQGTDSQNRIASSERTQRALEELSSSGSGTNSTAYSEDSDNPESFPYLTFGKNSQLSIRQQMSSSQSQPTKELLEQYSLLRESLDLSIPKWIDGIIDAYNEAFEIEKVTRTGYLGRPGETFIGLNQQDLNVDAWARGGTGPKLLCAMMPLRLCVVDDDADVYDTNTPAPLIRLGCGHRYHEDCLRSAISSRTRIDVNQVDLHTRKVWCERCRGSFERRERQDLARTPVIPLGLGIPHDDM
ncbi:hypothetical protein TWF788_008124 [Orbilia oligospora]|uniref:RING-type domain-containing protein n=1 Tax=Orbilia oligospora TaxID=2813651 RepID=A0A7C8U2K9_ORBOL|nr:hypothetical protein TWF788_008124 [Orbilia oligospora]